jgi:subtilisin family serine protease
MIVIPFGLPVYEPKIAGCINKALQRNIVCIAATGNQGANARIAFPAKMSGVIAIYSSDAHSNPSLFNANPLPGRKNFATLGEAISIREGRVGGEDYKAWTGTSCSATLASSIVASVIALAKSTLRLEPYALRILRTPKGVEALLELMSVSRGGYDYVAPWLLLSEDFWGAGELKSQTDREAYVKGKILAALH